jgi:hypothetical protein
MSFIEKGSAIIPIFTAATISRFNPLPYLAILSSFPSCNDVGNDPAPFLGDRSTDLVGIFAVVSLLKFRGATLILFPLV